MAHAVDLFSSLHSEMNSNDLGLDAPIIPDGKIHRYSSDPSSKKSEKDEWYICYEGTSINSIPWLLCIYGSWKKGGTKYEFKSWESDGRSDSLNHINLEVIEAKKKEIEQTIEQDLEHRVKRGRDLYLNSSASPGDDNRSVRYLLKKHLSLAESYEIRFVDITPIGPSLIIPLMDYSKNEAVGCQIINEEGEKRIYGKKKGCFFLLQAPGGFNTMNGPIWIVEGYATGASIFSATLDKVAIAFDCGNLREVAKTIQQLWPEELCLIAGDDDWMVEGNPGKKKAIECQQEGLVGFCVFPEFDENREKGDTDWNDLHVQKGKEEVRRQLLRQIESKIPSLLPKDEAQAEKVEALMVRAVNKVFCQIDQGNPVWVETRDKGLSEDEYLSKPYELLSHEGLIQRLQSKTIWKYSSKKKDPLTKGEWGKVWLKNSSHLSAQALIFDPSKRTGLSGNLFNLWTGLAVRPLQRSWIKFGTHIFENVCAGNQQMFTFFWNIMAYWFQHPERRTVCPVIRGPQGCGKGIVANAICKIFGRAALATSDHEQVFGRFNDSLFGRCFVYLDEAMFGGHRAIIGSVKRLITEDCLRIEAKGKPVFSIRNVIKCLVTTNEDFCIPIDPDDRRFVFFDMQPAKDPSYYEEIIHELYKNEGLEGFLYSLLNHKIDDNFNELRPPNISKLTGYGLDNKVESAKPALKYMFTMAERGCFPICSEESSLLGEEGSCLEVTAKMIYDDFLNFCDIMKLKKEMNASFAKTFCSVLSGAKGFEKSVKKINSMAHRVYQLPGVASFREAVAKVFKIDPSHLSGANDITY